MAKRENPRRREREFNKLQEKQNRSERKREYLENKKNRNNVAADNRIKRNNVEFGTEEIREDLVLGRNAVIEALKSNTTIEYISVAKGDLEGSIKVVLGLAKEKNVIVKEVDILFIFLFISVMFLSNCEPNSCIFSSSSGTFFAFSL